MPLIAKCLAKIRQSNITVIMVTLAWHVAAWNNQLQELAQKSISLSQSCIVCMGRLRARVPLLGWLIATVVQGKGLSPQQQRPK